MPKLESGNIIELFSLLESSPNHEGRFLRLDRNVWLDPQLHHEGIARLAQIKFAHDGGFIYAHKMNDQPEIDLDGWPYNYPLDYSPKERGITAEVIREIANGKNIRVMVF